MKYIVRTTPGYSHWIEYLKSRIPNLIVCMDTTRNGMDTFLKALEIAGDDACIHLEDDVLLTKDFISKIEDVVEENKDMVVNFFSMRKADLEIGTRVEAGRTFLSSLCFYLPEGESRKVLEHYPYRDKAWIDPTGFDLLVADYMKRNKMKYKIYIPNLVQHRVAKSRINSSRSTKRQSLTFKDLDE